MNKFVLFLSLIFLVSGCSTFKGIELPKTEVSKSRQQQLLTTLEANSSKLSSFRGVALAEHEIKKDHYRVRYLFAVKAPKNIHFEALPTTSGMAMSILKSDGKNAVMLDTAPQIAYMDVADEGIIKRALSISLPPVDLLFLLTGRVPTRIFAPTNSIQVFEEGSKIYLEINQGREVYEIDSSSNMLSRAVFRDTEQSRVSLDIRWSESLDQDNKVPKVIEITIPKDSYNGTLTWRTAEINPTLKSSLFDPTPPKGWEVKRF